MQRRALDSWVYLPATLLFNPSVLLLLTNTYALIELKQIFKSNTYRLNPVFLGSLFVNFGTPISQHKDMTEIFHGRFPINVGRKFERERRLSLNLENLF